jgi:peroxiredoxin
MQDRIGDHEPAPEPEPGAAAARGSLWRTIQRFIDVGFWVLLIGVLGWRFGPQLLAATGTGDTAIPAPAFEVTTFDGETVSLESLRGKVVLVNFWATWCPPCRQEMPSFERIWKERRDDGLIILGVSTDRIGADAVTEFVRDRGFTYPIAMAPGSMIRDYGGARALPSSFLIDRAGNIRHEVTGYFAEPALRAALNRLLDE